MKKLLFILGLTLFLTSCSLELYDEYPTRPYSYYPRYYVPNYPYYLNPYFSPYYYRPHNYPNYKPNPSPHNHYGPRK